MTILSVAQDASPKLGISRPSQLVADTGSTSVELQVAIKETARLIADRYDWEVYKATGTLTGDGAATTFAKPTDYMRMLKDGGLWPSVSPGTPLTHILDDGLWRQYVEQDFVPAYGIWRIYGGQFEVLMGGSSSPLGLADTVTFDYITNKLFANNGGTAQATITADTDTFRLDERLLRLGLIYRWKEDKGRPFAADMDRFEDALMVAIASNKGPKVLRMGGKRLSADTVAFPWPLG